MMSLRPAAWAVLPLLLLAAAGTSDVDPPGWVEGGPAGPAPASPSGEKPVSAGPQETGESLAEGLGCGACHQGMPGVSSIRSAAPRLGQGGASVPAAFAFEYLADPTPRRSGIEPARMPDFRLSEEERLALALYLSEGPGPPGEAAAGTELREVQDRHPHVSARSGELLFQGLGCSGCHGAEDPLPVGPDLSRAGVRLKGEWVRGFLGAPGSIRPSGSHPGTGSRMPDFRLSGEEVAALSDFLAGRGEGTLAAEPSPAVLTAWGERRAETYLTDRLSCLGCHQWRGNGGRLAPPLDGVAARLTPEAVRATVLHPDEMVGWSIMPPSLFRPDILEEVAALLTGGGDGRGAELPPQPQDIPWADREAFLTEFIRSSQAAPDALGSEDPREGVYVRHCAACHGLGGDGRGFNAPNLPVTPTVHSDSARMALRPDDTLYDGIAAGGWVLDRSHRMPAFGGALTPSQIRSAVAYIRILCRCRQPDWAAGAGSGP